MPELSTFFPPPDDLLLVQWLFDRGAFLVPAVPYDNADYSECSEVAAYRASLEGSRHFYVLHPSFTRERLSMVRVDRGWASGRFCILSRDGGPAIEFLSSTVVSKPDGRLVTGGFLAYHPTYWSPSSQENEPAPQPLVALYRSAVRFIKMNSTEVVLTKTKHWLSQAALNLWRSGAILPGFEGAVVQSVGGQRVR